MLVFTVFGEIFEKVVFRVMQTYLLLLVILLEA